MFGGTHFSSLGEKIGKGLVNGAGWKSTLRNVRNSINC